MGKELGEIKMRRLQELAETRLQWAAQKKEAETMLKDLDDEIKIEMIQAGLEKEKFAWDGHTFKIQPGTNRSFTEENIRRTLLSIELDPDEIDWCIGDMVQEKDYDYIDMRKMKEEKEG